MAIKKKPGKKALTKKRAAASVPKKSTVVKQNAKKKPLRLSLRAKYEWQRKHAFTPDEPLVMIPNVDCDDLLG
jgi:hypothetical protein